MAHDHNHRHATASYDKAFAIGIGLNLVYVIIEAAFGVLSGSLALIADAGHNLSDVDDPPGTARWMQYSQNGEHRMTVVVEVRASHGYVRLQHPSRASDCTEHRDYTVGLIWTVPRFGGRRWWFSCPLSGRRCGVLYLPRGASKFASAKGHGLDYAVTRMSKRDQIWIGHWFYFLGGKPEHHAVITVVHECGPVQPHRVAEFRQLRASGRDRFLPRAAFAPRICAS